MAQLVVRNLDDYIRDKLRAMAEANGRNIEEEVREILREATLRSPFVANTRLETRVAERFRGWGLDADIEELRGQPVRPADFEQ